jgi:hypothetical protein
VAAGSSPGGTRRLPDLLVPDKEMQIMGLFSKDANKGWGGKGDKCVITGGKATGTSRTAFGGKVKTGKAINGKGK